jgi:hypothetical protein
MAEQRIQMFESRTLRRIVGTKREEETAGWRIFNLFNDTFSVMKTR